MDTDAFEAVIAPRIILCDRIIREEGTGKLSLIGCFEGFLSPTFPFQSIPFFVAVAITNITAFPDQIDVVLRMQNTVGHVIASSQAQLTKKPDAPPMPRHANIDIVFPFGPVRFDTPGLYELVCVVSKEELAKRQFEVRPLTANPQQIQ